MRQVHCLATLSTLCHVQTEAAEGMELAKQNEDWSGFPPRARKTPWQNMKTLFFIRMICLH